MDECPTTSPPSPGIFACSGATQIMPYITLDDLPIHSPSLARDLLGKTSLPFGPRLLLFHLFPAAEDDGRGVRGVLGGLCFEKIGVRLRIVRVRLISLGQERT